MNKKKITIINKILFPLLLNKKSAASANLMLWHLLGMPRRTANPRLRVLNHELHNRWNLLALLSLGTWRRAALLFGTNLLQWLILLLLSERVRVCAGWVSNDERNLQTRADNLRGDSAPESRKLHGRDPAGPEQHYRNFARYQRSRVGRGKRDQVLASQELVGHSLGRTGVF